MNNNLNTQTKTTFSESRFDYIVARLKQIANDLGMELNIYYKDDRKTETVYVGDKQIYESVNRFSGSTINYSMYHRNLNDYKVVLNIIGDHTKVYGFVKDSFDHCQFFHHIHMMSLTEYIYKNIPKGFNRIIFEIDRFFGFNESISDIKLNNRLYRQQQESDDLRLLEISKMFKNAKQEILDMKG